MRLQYEISKNEGKANNVTFASEDAQNRIDEFRARKFGKKVGDILGI